MQTVSANFTAACSDGVQRPVSYFEVTWRRLGLRSAARAGAYWIDETPRLISANAQLNINPPGDKLIAAGAIGRMTVVLANEDGRYSWKNPNSALYAHIGGEMGMIACGVRLWQGFSTVADEYVCVFTGFITSWRELQNGTIELNCLDWGWKYLQSKGSTAVVTNQLSSNWISAVATSAGMLAGDMVLDVGIYRIPFCWRDDESVVEEIWDTASADGGVAYFDQLGRLRYENVLHWLSHTSVWTFDEGQYQLGEPDVGSDDVTTKVIVEYAGRYIGGVVNLYKLSQYRVIQPGQIDSWTARFDYGASRIYDPDYEAPYEDYYAASIGGTTMTAQLTVVLSQLWGQQVRVSVRNNSSIAAARLLSFRIRGLPLIGGPTEQAEQELGSSVLSFERVRTERGNPYTQTRVQAQAIADALALRTARCRPIYSLSGIMGVPQLELMDFITFADSTKFGSGGSIIGLVIGIQAEVGGGAGYMQSFKVMDVSDLFAYTNYFTVGVSALGDTARAYH